MSAIFGFAFACVLVYLVGKWLRHLPHAVREVFTIGGLIALLTAFIFVLILMLTDTSSSVLWVRVVAGTGFMLGAAWAAVNAVLRSMIMARDRVLADLVEPEFRNRPY